MNNESLSFDEIADFDAQQRRKANDQLLRFKNSNKFTAAWNNLPEEIGKWLCDSHSPSEKFNGLLKRLHDACVTVLGDDCFRKIVGFDAAIYKSDGDQANDRDKKEIFFAAQAVENVLSWLCDIDSGTHTKSIINTLDDFKSQFKLGTNRRLSFAHAAIGAKAVLLRGEPNARCSKCNEPLEFWTKHLEKVCSLCDGGQREKREIQDQLTYVLSEIRSLESMTKEQAIGTGRTVEKWIDAAFSLYSRLSYLCEPAEIQRQRAIDKALAIADLIGTEHDTGNLMLRNWQANALQLYSKLLGAALNRDETQTKMLLYDLLEFNSAASLDSETLGNAPLKELRRMIGITPENVYGAGGTFQGNLPDEWCELPAMDPINGARLEQPPRERADEAESQNSESAVTLNIESRAIALLNQLEGDESVPNDLITKKRIADDLDCSTRSISRSRAPRFDNAFRLFKTGELPQSGIINNGSVDGVTTDPELE